MNKVAVVTGSSSGFGLFISIELAKIGYDVLATMRDLNKSEELIKLATKEGVINNIHLFKLDVSEQLSIENFKMNLNQFSRVDVLVNNAGYAQSGFIEELPLQELKEQFDTNVFGVASVTKVVLPLMRKQNSGTIVNMSSISGLIGFPGLAAYVSSKHALEGLSESMRLELKPFGIHVVLIEPGSYSTNIWSKGMDIEINEESPYYKMGQRLMVQVKSGQTRLGNPKDVVDLVVKVIKKRKPKLRYSIGKGVRSTIIIKRILPWSIWEYIVNKTLQKK
ncbi:short-chain dehydrogenase [Lottiidibacillus patelloidae]|uniref:Short-chain dehydrogenase n=1 Tax=Lottiidibacillus patelloidae TaxID=2670334 RepID=A0A263BVK9_9BACI|nr:SDR family oxidoreductase [Lottiidibacillus patelloidae]OZM57206.1 short-chain dehydrogenase [Lottiidibacillus patelloidae]